MACKFEVMIMVVQVNAMLLQLAGIFISLLGKIHGSLEGKPGFHRH